MRLGTSSFAACFKRYAATAVLSKEDTCLLVFYRSNIVREATRMCIPCPLHCSIVVDTCCLSAAEQ